MSSIEQRIRKVILEELKVSEEQLTSDASFSNDLGADSLSSVELILALEEEFDIEIQDQEAEKISSLRDAVSCITNLVENK